MFLCDHEPDNCLDTLDTLAAANLLCLQEIMREPVIVADGYTYERHAIDAWLQHHNVSPVTGKHLTHKLLVDNTVMKSLIQQQRA